MSDGIEEIVEVTITALTTFPDVVGFGTPLALCHHGYWPERVRFVRSDKELADAGVPAWHPVRRIAQKVFGSPIRPSRLGIGKRIAQATQTLRMFPTSNTDGVEYAFTLDYLGASVEVSYTVDDDTIEAVATGIAAEIGAVAGLTITSTATYVQIVAAAGTLVNLRSLPLPTLLGVLDTTANPSVADSLDACLAASPNGWYGLLLDTTGAAEIAAAAAWIQANGKLALFNTSDYTTLDSEIDSDVLSAGQAASYSRSGVITSFRELLSYSAAAWMGCRLPLVPGGYTWNLVTLPGVTVDALTSGQVGVLHGKGGNVYTSIAGFGATRKGTALSGEFLDITHGIDETQRRIQERVLGILKAASDAGRKVPYTDTGVDIVRSGVLQVLGQKEVDGFINPGYVVQAPRVADVDPAVKAGRLLPDITFTAQMQGAIHTVTVVGTLTI